MSFKENLEEQYQRSKYRKENFIFLFFSSSLIAIIILSIFGFSEGSWFGYILGTPINPNTSTYYILALLVVLTARAWWYGVPSYVLFLSKYLFFPAVKLSTLLRKIKIIDDAYKKITPEKSTVEKIKRGKEKELVKFFYPKVEISDEIPRAKMPYFFRTKKYHAGNIFDYSALGMKEDLEGTQRIMSLFRDKRMEGLKKRAKSHDPKIAKRAQDIISRRNAAYKDKGLPSPEQVSEYNDLFSAIEGIYESYEGAGNKIIKKNIKSPLTIKTKKGKILGAKVDETVDVFSDGEVYFSLDMITVTVARLTILYADFLKKRTATQGRFTQKRLGKILSLEENMTLFEDFFKFVMMRRFLMNYSGIPSGWICARVESYDLRAIVSTVDRPLIPSITSMNDGSNDDFPSDVTAASFLFTYWSFMEETKDIIESLDWCFYTTKDLNETKAREASREESKKTEDMLKKFEEENKQKVDEYEEYVLKRREEDRIAKEKEEGGAS